MSGPAGERPIGATPPDDTGGPIEQQHAELGAAFVAGIVTCALAAWAFSGLLEEVLDNATMVRWDVAASAWMHDRATAAGLQTFAAVTQLGQGVAWIVSAVVAVWLWRRHERLLLGTWLAGNVGGVLLDQALKHTVQRVRPAYAVKYLHGHSYSFPSGHTMAAAVCYTLLAYVLADTLDWTRARRAVAYLVAAMLVLLVAVSRVYLGVHFPSDVAGGVAAGVAWVAACCSVLRFVRHRAVMRRAASLHPR